MTDSDALSKQIEAAYDYRGHVTISLKAGGTLEGFVYNRILKSPRMPDGGYLDVMVKDSDEKRRLRFDEIASIALSGKDFAETFEDGLKRTGTPKKS
ncbi:MAG: hypothetical protein KGL53_05155 [Elusimicrobia bacterium]|nr:hypothetical protein [Elusimicrobiota bacterium]